MANLNEPATKADLLAAEERMKAEVIESEQRMKAEVIESEQHMQEFMRGLQTELLRGFASYADGSNIRFRKIETDASNSDAATMLRMSVFEDRLTKLEVKIWGDRPRP